MAVICWLGEDGSLGRLETDGPWMSGAESPAPEGATVIAEIQWQQIADDRVAEMPVVANLDNADPFGEV